MIDTTVGEIASALGGTLSGVAADVRVTAVVTDSREVRPGALFVCRRGEASDGHAFASAAVSAGAVACIADHDIDVPAIVVAGDTTAALGRLAAWARTRLSATVIGITGSTGKTTTKDMLAQILASAGPTIAPPNSYNNEVGMPVTVLQADEQTAFLVLEMGMRGLGHISELAAVGKPDIAVITNVGSAHLGELGSREDIARAKGEILDGLPATGTAVLYGDDAIVRALATRTLARTITFGEGPDCDVRAEHVWLDEQARPSFTLTFGDARADVSMQYVGEHAVSNALAAAAAALAAGVDLGVVAAALGKATPQSRWRMEVSQTPSGITVVNDAYNANPESMRAALKALAAMANGRRTFAVLGEMLELGPDTVAEHDAIGRLAVRLDISQLICVGPGTRVMHLGAAGEGSWDNESIWVPDNDAALAKLRELLRPGDIVLVKASRGIGLERVVADLLVDPVTAGGTGEVRA